MHWKRFVNQVAAIMVCSFIFVSLFLNTAQAVSSSMHPTIMGVYDREEDFFLGSLHVAPIDTQYMSVEVWNLLDSLGADSVQREYPAYGPADTLFTRPDGKEVRLPDLSRLYLIYFQDSVVFLDFQPLYNVVAPVSDVYPNYIGTNLFIPIDLSPTKQPYLFDSSASSRPKQAIDAVAGPGMSPPETPAGFYASLRAA